MTSNNLVMSEKEEIKAQGEIFYSIAFQHSIFSQLYQNTQEQKLCQLSEEIIGNALNYFRGLLEDPNIW